MTHENPYKLTLVQGKRFRRVWRWPQILKVYKPVNAMPSAAPVRFSVTGHGAPDGWPVRFTGIKGPSQVNDRWVKATVVDANTIEINALNAGDMPAYAGGGYMEYFAPVDLSVFTAGRATLKEVVTDASPVLDITIANGRMLLDNALKTITFDVDGPTLAALTKYSGIWDWEMTASGGIQTPLGAIALPPWQLIREAAT